MLILTFTLSIFNNAFASWTCVNSSKVHCPRHYFRSNKTLGLIASIVSASSIIPAAVYIAAIRT